MDYSQACCSVRSSPAPCGGGVLPAGAQRCIAALGRDDRSRIEQQRSLRGVFTVTLTAWLASHAEPGRTRDAAVAAAEVRIGARAGQRGRIGDRAGLERLALPAGLHPLLAVAGAVGPCSSLTNLMGDRGFLSVYLAGSWSQSPGARLRQQCSAFTMPRPGSRAGDVSWCGPVVTPSELLAPCCRRSRSPPS